MLLSAKFASFASVTKINMSFKKILKRIGSRIDPRDTLNTTQKMKIPIKDFYSKCAQIRRKEKFLEKIFSHWI